MQTEIWKDIPGYEGRYQASTLGRIKNIERKVRGRNRYTGAEFYRTVPECVLRPGRYCSSGHVSVVLEHGGNGKPVHQLVMKTFIGEPPEKCEVLHYDGDPTNNKLDNLRYGSRTENILDVFRLGGRWRKLTAHEAKIVQASLDFGARGTDIARKFNVSPSTISSIKVGRTFGWLNSAL